MTLPTEPSEIFRYLATTPNDGRLELRVPAELETTLQLWAEENEMPVSLFARYLLLRGLAIERADNPTGVL